MYPVIVTKSDIKNSPCYYDGHRRNAIMYCDRSDNRGAVTANVETERISDIQVNKYITFRLSYMFDGELCEAIITESGKLVSINGNGVFTREDSSIADVALGKLVKKVKKPSAKALQSWEQE